MAKFPNVNETSDDYSNATTTIPDDMMTMNTYIYIYTAIVLAIFFVGIIRSIVFYLVCMACSQRLHDMMFSALIRTGMYFFDTNPSGRILNRFSKDMGAIDELLPKAILDAGQLNLMMLGALIVTCAVNPIFLIPVVIIAFIFYWIRKVYLKTGKNIKRLEGISTCFASLSGMNRVNFALRSCDRLQFEICTFFPKIPTFNGIFIRCFSTIASIYSSERHIERIDDHQSVLRSRDT